jgi:hypothetical protein
MLLTSLLVVLTVPLGGAVNAYWSGSGLGGGAGETGTGIAVTLSPGTPAAELYPGGTANVILTASNSNSSPARIDSLGLDLSQGLGTGFAVDGGHAGCAVSTLSFTNQTNAGSGWTVPAKAGAVNGTLSINLTSALAMGVGAANACQGASTTVFLKAGP